MTGRNASSGDAKHRALSARHGLVQEERETKTAKSRQCSSAILTIAGHCMFLKRTDSCRSKLKVHP
jgi:hypothetical protein